MRLGHDKQSVMGRGDRTVLDMRQRRMTRTPVGSHYHLECKVTGASQVTIRGGTNYTFAGGDLVITNLATAGAEYTGTADLAVPAGTGTRYVIVTKDDALNPTTWTASVSASAPSAADRTVMQIAHFAATDGAVSGKLYQDWQGGNVCEFYLAPDGKSLSYNSSDQLQAVDYANSGDTAPAADDRFWFHDIDGDTMVLGATPQQIVEAVSDWSGVDMSSNPPTLYWSDLQDTSGDPTSIGDGYIPVTTSNVLTLTAKASVGFWVTGGDKTTCNGSTAKIDDIYDNTGDNHRIDVKDRQWKGGDWAADNAITAADEIVGDSGGTYETTIGDVDNSRALTATDGTRDVQLCDASGAVYATDGTRIAYLCDGTNSFTGNRPVQALSFKDDNGNQVVGARVSYADLANTPNTGDSDTDDMIQALADTILGHGLADSNP